MKNSFKTAVFFLAGLFLLSLSLTATEEITVRRRMSERLPTVDALKLSGHVGENNIGYLMVRKDLTPEQTSLVAAENGDRKTIYSIIAIKTYTTAILVGQHRAHILAERSVKGVWLQSETGDWGQK